ncbi:MAG: extracellular solute-binding protein [Simkaniaceae bacterium]|nr:extracellular solute-binding protein [Simkaniaceae bacterium]
MRKFLIAFGWAILFLTLIYLPSSGLLTRSDERTLNIFTWADMFHPEGIAAFERDTGIKVNLHPFTSNEELLVKLAANPGGYDLITPSDYAAEILMKKGALKVLDHKKLDHLNKLYPFIANMDYDPNQSYTIPFCWEPYGLSINRAHFKDRKFSSGYSPIFDKEQIDYKITMTPEPGEAVAFAAFHLFGPVTHLTPVQAKKVRKLLQEQRQWVSAYSDYRSQYLMMTGNSNLTISRASFAWMAINDVPEIEFVLPENPHISIETLAIPKESHKDALIYSFMNYVMKPENHIKHVEVDLMYPCIKGVLEKMQGTPPEYAKTFYKAQKCKKLYLFRLLIPEEQTRDIWVSTKT